jgi:RNA polymerase sigma-70 factor (ECF subfamily)
MAELARALPWEPAERTVVAELQAGSEQAFDWLVTHYHGLVYNLLCGALGDAADAADATQEVFLKAFRGIRGFRQGSSLKTWLYRIALREASNQRRWFWRHRRGETPLETPTGEPAIELPDGEASPFERLAAAEEQRMVRQALAQVPEVFRQAVILRDLEDLSYEEVAEVLEVSVGTVKSRILRGRRLLRELLSPLVNAGRGAAAAPRARAMVFTAGEGSGLLPSSGLGVSEMAPAYSRRPSDGGGA